MSTAVASHNVRFWKSIWFSVLLAVVALILTPFQAPAVVAGPEESGVAQAQGSATGEESELIYVKMETSKGDIVIELDHARAPISVGNFLAYVDDEYYDGTIFHRVMPTFMIQGGGFTTDLEKKRTDVPIKNEWRNGLKNKRGTIAMARVGGNPDSATSQFFINVVNNPNLDHPQPDGAAYAVFGRVVEGMDVVDKIRYVKTRVKGSMKNLPVETVEIKNVERIEWPKKASDEE